jgi:hypothetical protein
MNKTILGTAILTLFSSTVEARAADTVVLLPAHNRSVNVMVRDASSYRVWKVSLAPVIAGQALDAASSYNMREVNPLLASADGRFGMKATTIKFGATAAILGVEYLIVRKRPGASRILSRLNWSVGIATAGFAAHNFAIK